MHNSNSDKQFVTISVSCAQADQLKIIGEIIQENDVRPLMPVLSKQLEIIHRIPSLSD